jgi:hypothetical protein
MCRAFHLLDDFGDSVDGERGLRLPGSRAVILNLAEGPAAPPHLRLQLGHHIRKQQQLNAVCSFQRCRNPTCSNSGTS